MKKYKIMFVTTLYERYIDYLYHKNEELSFKSYQEQISDIFFDSFSGGNFLELELQKLGVEASTYLYNVWQLQRVWRAGFSTKTMFEIFLSQLEYEDPDVLYIDDVTSLFSIIELKEIRKKIKSTAKVVGWHFTSVDEKFKENAALFDQIYTGSKYFVNLLKQYNINTKLLHHAFAPELLQRAAVKTRTLSIGFSGSIMIPMHSYRLSVFANLLRRGVNLDIATDIYGSYFFPSFLDVARYVKRVLYGKDVFNICQIRKDEKLIKSVTKPAVFGLDYFRFIGSHNICLNINPFMTKKGTGNIRMFETTGMGACLLTDYRDENREIFEPDYEIVEYNSVEELNEKIDWLLSHPATVESIASAGQKRTLQYYTYKNKAEQLNEYIQGLIN